MNNEQLRAFLDNLEKAISNKNLITFWYADKERTVEPHQLYEIEYPDYGLLGWSVGFSASNTEPAWRNYDVHAMSNLKVLEKSFQPRDFDAGRHGNAIATVKLS